MNDLNQFRQNNYDRMYKILKNNGQSIILLNELWGFLSITLVA